MASQIPLSHFSVDSRNQRSLITSQWPEFTFTDQLKFDNSNSDNHSTYSTHAASTHHIFTPTRRVAPSGCFNRLKRMCTRFPVRDPSWLTASTFTIGSALFVINGFFLLLPLVRPDTDFKTESSYAGPVTSILGNVFFVAGGLTAVVEAMNMKRGEIDGGGIDIDINRDLEEGSSDKDKKSKRKPQHQINEDVINALEAARKSVSLATPTMPALIGTNAFIWSPSMAEFRHVYMKDAMFIAAFIQMLGTFVFAMSAITGIPGVMDLTNVILLDTLSLLPSLLGGIGFLISGIIQTILAQDKWYKPKPLSLLWHVGFWNSIGSIGFCLAGALPYWPDKVGYQGTLSDFWGSWAFMIGSGLYWYIVMENYP